MPTDIEDLVGFIASPNPMVRQIALDSLIPYSINQPSIFKADDLLPVKNLKPLIRDHPKIAEPAITILVNLSGDGQVVQNVASDDKFVQALLESLVKEDEPNANLIAMLLANLSKWDGIKDAVLRRGQAAPAALRTDDLVLNQLVDLFVKGSDGTFNKKADYDHLAYVFADLAQHAEVRQYLVRRQVYDDAIPLTKLKVFTEHPSEVRRKGVASTIKNVAFDVHSHAAFLDEDGIDIMPYVLLPITGSEEYPEDESLSMLPDLQLLPPDKRRDPDASVVRTHVETLTLLATTRAGRDLMRDINVYPVIRETHLRVDDEGVKDACDRLVQVLMRDEEDEGGQARVDEVGQKGGDAEEDEDDDRIVEV